MYDIFLLFSILEHFDAVLRNKNETSCTHKKKKKKYKDNGISRICN